jgi:hypothetical protein
MGRRKRILSDDLYRSGARLFVIDSRSVGGKIYSRVSGVIIAVAIGIGPRVGYNLGLTDNIDLAASSLHLRCCPSAGKIRLPVT